jgi:hypothetical protein
LWPKKPCLHLQHLVSCFIVTNLKFLILFEQGALHFHFGLDHTINSIWSILMLYTMQSLDDQNSILISCGLFSPPIIPHSSLQSRP